ncbi:MAG: hypothetical protein EXQ90_01600 [Rhodospirillales bacterium]|nr:hypothetical protein [Rhodospirillales bacterium]
MATPPAVQSAIPYDEWLVDAFRSVLRRALEQVEREGLTGSHHFYITFATEAPGVILHDSIRAQHPTEMTIVLQNQFHDLVVEPEAFSVALRFNGIQRPLRIPFTAVMAFLDPGVNFGLQLKLPTRDLEPAPAAAPAKPEPAAEPATGDAADKVVSLETFRRK